MQTASPGGHDVNVIAAAAVLVAERVHAAVEAATGVTGASAAAVTALAAWADGGHIDALAGGLRLSHSRAVRVVDRLERDGLAVRRADPHDARRALVHLTPAGHALAAAALTARSEAVSGVVAHLSADRVADVARVAEALLFDQSVTRTEARAICRMCDVVACGHRAGRCPSTSGADSREALQYQHSGE